MHPETRRILHDELWRSAAWLFVAVVMWPIILQQSSLEVNVGTVFLPMVAIYVGLTAGMIGLRLATGVSSK